MVMSLSGRPLSWEMASADALDDEMIAELSDVEIRDMNREELIRVIRGSRHPWRPEGMCVDLDVASGPTLLRLAFLARLCCRNRASGDRHWSACELENESIGVPG